MNHKEINDTINTFSFSLYNILFEEFRFIKDKLDTNLVLSGLFFHDIMVLLTSYFIKVNEIKFNMVLSSLVKEKLNSFPYIDYTDILENVDYSNKKLITHKPNSINYEYKFIQALTALFHRNGKKIGIGSIPKGLNLREFFFDSIRNGNRIIFLTDQNYKIKIPNYDFQVKSLLHKIRKFIQESNIKEINETYFISLITNYFNNICFGQGEMPEIDVLITGEIMAAKNRNRLNAAHCYEKNIPVVGVLHGYATGVLDEPNNGYGENSYITDLIMYGQYRFDFVSAPYQKPLTTIKRIHYISSDVVKNLYKPKNKIKIISDIHNPKILYVPTLFCGFGTYGPCRQLPDKIYIDWIKHLSKSIPNLSIKFHPKGYKINDPGIRAQSLDGYFEDIINDFNIFIFDYISSAFTLACATDKPIIFCNLGINNITDESYKIIKKRTVFIDIDNVDDKDIYNKILSGKNQTMVNNYTEKYSLSSGWEQQNISQYKRYSDTLDQYLR